jgi:O-antigen/teichoic acid export membrane protein
MFSSKLFSLKQSKKLLKLSFPYYLWSVNHFVKNSFQIIIIGLYFNANIVGLITTFKTLFYFLPIKITNIIGRSLTYEFTKYYAEKKFSLLKKIFAKFIKTISICMIIYIIIISVIGESIYNLWITNLQIFDYILMILIILDVSIYIIGYYFAIINRSINNFLSQSVFDTLMNISTILIFVYLYKWYQSYYLLFILNIITTILLLLFSIYMAKKVIKSFDLVGK